MKYLYSLVLVFSLAYTQAQDNTTPIHPIQIDCKGDKHAHDCTIDAIYNSLLKDLRYPILAKDNKIQGQVYLQYTIDTLGDITEYFIVKGIGGGCDRSVLTHFNKV